MRILLLDIETAPNLAYVWGIWKQNINPEWIAANGYVLCWTAKWHQEDEIFFHRLRKGKPLSLLRPIHKLLDEADAVVHYNGSSFDIPTLNKEFITHKLNPPSPYKEIDLLLTMRDRFRFPSNKLDYIAQTLQIGSKIRHSGPQLWLDCMSDKKQAWADMEEYNKQDVTLLEQLYERLKPWIKRHPNVAAHDEAKACPTCGGSSFQRRGTYTTQQMKYIRYQCQDCATWFRGVGTITTTRRTERVSPVA